MKNEQWLDTMVSSLAHANTGLDFSTFQPLDTISFHTLFAKEWISFIQTVMQKCTDNHLSIADRAKLFPHSGETSCQLFLLLLDSKTAGTTKQERIELARFWVEILDYQRNHDPFLLRGKNHTNTPEQLDQKIRKIAFQPATPEIARKLGRIYLAAYHLVNGFYTDWYTDFGVEIHGDYDVSKHFKPHHTWIVKEMKNLKPVELFSLARTSPANNLELHGIYENVQISVEMFTPHFSYTGDPINGLRKWALLADGKPVMESQLDSLMSQLSDFSVQQWAYIKELPFEDLKQTVISQRSFVYKQACDKLGLDWRPNKAMQSAVREKPIPSSYYHVPTQESEKLEYWTKLVDPRTDFNGH